MTTTTQILDLPIKDISVPIDRARDYDAANAEALAAIIAAQGLFHPIRVQKLSEGYTLVSGLHRLRAFEMNAAEKIPAIISAAETHEAARLEEVMENLGRGELIALDRCHHLYELKQAWAALHPDFANGGGKTFPTGQDAPEIYGFASDMAEKVGLSKRAINSAVKIWTDLTADAVRRLVGTDLARKQTELKALSEQKPAMQRRILDLILSDNHPSVKNVASALEALGIGEKTSVVEKQYRAVSVAFKALPDDSFDQLVRENEDRIVASLKRLGM